MSFIRYGADLNVLLVTKGHPFLRDPFFAIFDAFPDIACSNVEQPAAQAFFTPQRAEPYDAFVMYDMPGIEFSPGGPAFHDPPVVSPLAPLALLALPIALFLGWRIVVTLRRPRLSYAWPTVRVSALPGVLLVVSTRVLRPSVQVDSSLS